MIDQAVREALATGLCRLERRGAHPALRFVNTNRLLPFAYTPSDGRASLNFRADVRRELRAAEAAQSLTLTLPNIPRK